MDRKLLRLQLRRLRLHLHGLLTKSSLFVAPFVGSSARGTVQHHNIRVGGGQEGDDSLQDGRLQVAWLSFLSGILACKRQEVAAAGLLARLPGASTAELLIPHRPAVEEHATRCEQRMRPSIVRHNGPVVCWKNI